MTISIDKYNFSDDETKLIASVFEGILLSLSDRQDVGFGKQLCLLLLWNGIFLKHNSDDDMVEKRVKILLEIGIHLDAIFEAGRAEELEATLRTFAYGDKHDN